MLNNKKVLIIAEVGVNHNGDLTLAKECVDAAKESGADIVKFQTFKASSLLTKKAKKAEYQRNNTSSKELQYQMIKDLELSWESHIKIHNHCKKRRIEFLSSPFDLASLEFLKSLNLKRFKIPSGEITNLPLLQEIGRTGKPIILSTGMSTIKEIKSAMEVLVSEGAKKEFITILHCNTEYPTPIEDVNLAAMLTIKREFGTAIGYSDHTEGVEIPAAAVALGADVIEKHFTLDNTMKGPDHKASLEPKEFCLMVTFIRNIEKALGDGKKVPSNSELKNINIARKSIHALRRIEKNERFSEENICVKRPGNGLSPMEFRKVIGTKATKRFEEDDLIEI